MALINCNNVSFAYGKETVLTDVNFTLSSGDYLSVLGENGSGKTTLIKGILNLINTQTGEILFGDGLKVSDIGYLPQQPKYQQNFPATVFEIALSGRLLGEKKSFFYSDKDKKVTLENLELMGMEKYKNISFDSLSGGQQRRVLLARSLGAAKKVLLLDEPTSGLDPAATATLYSLIKKINNDFNISIIMVSHDISSALKYSSHILHLDKSMLFFGKKDDYLTSSVGKKYIGGITK